MKGFQVEVKGLTELKKKLDAYDKNLSKGVDEELSAGAVNIANRARQLAPHSKTGALAASIFSDVSRPMNKEVGSSLFYAAFVEFGTGVNVFQGPFDFTAEMKAFAREFYVSGKGRLPASPYLFPALIEEKKQIIKRIKEKVFKLK